jgi:phage terminase large subunit-like protein
MAFATLDQLKSLDKDQKMQLYLAMAYDSALYAEIIYGCEGKIDHIPDFHRSEYAIHDRMAKRELDRACFVQFRGAAKSTKKSLITSRDFAYGWEDCMMFTSESEEQTKQDVALVKSIAESEPYQWLFGDHVGSGSAKLWRESDCLINGRYLSGVGFKTRIRGAKHIINGIPYRPTKVIADDFESERNTNTEAQLKGIVRKIKSELEPMGRAGDFRLIFEGTIVHPESYLATARTNPLYTEAHRGAYLEFALSSDPYNIGVPTWPEVFPVDEILKKKFAYVNGNDNHQDVWQWLQEYYNLPRMESDPKFDTTMMKPVGATFNSYKHLTWLEYQGNITPINVFIGVDPASSLKATADRTVICTIGVSPNGDIFILDIFAERIHMTEQLQEIMKRAKKYNPRSITIETYGYQGELLDAWKRAMSYENLYWSSIPFNEGIGKSRKFKEGLSLDINSGKVLYLDSCPNVQLMINEMKTFTGKEKNHDDTIDGFYLAKKNMFIPSNFDVMEEVRKLRLTQGQYDLVNIYENHVANSNNKTRSWRVN